MMNIQQMYSADRTGFAWSDEMEKNNTQCYWQVIHDFPISVQQIIHVIMF